MIDKVKIRYSKEKRSLQDARRVADRFASSLPDVIDSTTLTTHSKLPHKASVLRGALCHKISCLSYSAIAELDASRPLPAMVLVRALIETAAAVFSLSLQISSTLKQKNDDELNQFLNHLLLGERNRSNFLNLVNVLTMVNQVDKVIPNFSRLYDSLCKYTHPNWTGMAQSFSESSSKTFSLTPGPLHQSRHERIGLDSLIGGIMTAEHYFNSSGTLIVELSDWFDSRETTAGVKSTVGDLAIG